ncbi:FAD-binding protein [Pseudohoeflea coraliihabitans]|uniref:FAD-binding protein n=1 Tax=Pseudohoeflea coraliihabitans TaxID=2860393 RepID=A0ABS6WN94_9HYPH|nr:GMC oxidoreductase [Pseudohoeflea sp. DP4N28-3]MBW3096882.1 FAD-binding protein [Pseudohoeflea sp. DP4N28-3]
MSEIADVLVVGSGPAGVSVAFPLVEAGLKVLMVDGGKPTTQPLPGGNYEELCLQDREQWRWKTGIDETSLSDADNRSPKLRIPTHAGVFEDFSSCNRIISKDFVAIGSLAPGGLSNAWGCGVSRLSLRELSAFPCDPMDMERSYDAVSARIGLSGAEDDDLADYFRVDAFATNPVALDPLQEQLKRRYDARKERGAEIGIALGRSRLAVLTEQKGQRHACDSLGTCMWGCNRRAMYSALEDLRTLRSFRNFSYEPGRRVEQLGQANGLPVASTTSAAGPSTLKARRVVLAAGTLATSRLALQRLEHKSVRPMLSSPTAAFLLFVPGIFGRNRSPAFGLSQLSYTFPITASISGFGSLTDASNIPVPEFVRNIPIAPRYAIDTMAVLLSSCAVGNLFLPGNLTKSSVRLTADHHLEVSGRYSDTVIPLMDKARRMLNKSFRRLGSVVVPQSFTIGAPGSDIHYCGTLPMKLKKTVGNTGPHGELYGAEKIRIADGACLPILTEKSHTLTIMANADRIGRNLVAELTSEKTSRS